MKAIEIDPNVLALVPKEFLNLPDYSDYRLTKTESFRDGYVYRGDTVEGPLSIVDVLGKPGVKVANGFFRGNPAYIRTSPIIRVLDVTLDTIIFCTEGGIYKLERQDFR